MTISKTKAGDKPLKQPLTGRNEKMEVQISIYVMLQSGIFNRKEDVIDYDKYGTIIPLKARACHGVANDDR